MKLNKFLLVLLAVAIIVGGCTAKVVEEASESFTVVDSKDLETVVEEPLPVEEILFEVKEIDSSLEELMKGKSFHENDNISLEDLRVVNITHVGFDGEDHKGSLIVNEVIANEVLEIFKELYEASYPIEKVKPVYHYDGDDDLSMADNNSSAFNYRVVAGTDRLSNHSYGLAIDINPLINPYVTKNGVYPEEGSAYVERDASVPGLIVEGDACYEAFLSRGYIWGGHWNSVKDYQHFEKKIDGINQ